MFEPQFDFEKSPPKPPTQCGKCGNPMEEGYTVDRGESNWTFVDAWYPGKPKKNWIGALKLRKAEARRTISYRCTNCGLIEQYAI